MNKKELWVLAPLTVAIVAVSSAAAAFDEITSVSAFMKASWRLQVTATFQLIPLSYECYKNWYGVLDMWKANWRLIALSGLSLSLHFTLWCWSLELTSMAHSLLFVCTSPLIIVVVYLILCKPIHIKEIIGVIVGFVGLALTILETTQGGDATWYGDLIAIVSAMAVTLYFFIGKAMMKQTISIWVYLTPVNFQAAIWSYALALLINNEDPGRFVQWIYTSDWVWALYLGIVPGIIGHGILNTLLKHVSVLIITVFVNFEPVIGTFIGWLAGLQGPPGIFTYIGGVIVVIGNIIVTLAGQNKESVEDETENQQIASSEREEV
ncbi:unnamed protein product [Blepharisma stoltei]|uniref:EamA domain-containing protein n=1 Tax=Blepharisma stoltei TaxID=1481888 RepID=A0AAU9IVN2_9CILI|nr:unnamed protein product [Blepharisma stoltei]